MAKVVLGNWPHQGS